MFYERAAAFDTCQLRRLQTYHINVPLEAQGSHNHPLFAVSPTKWLLSDLTLTPVLSFRNISSIVG